MGLNIYGEKTGHSLSESYSTIHLNLRWLALRFCGMPVEIEKAEIESYSYLYRDKQHIDPFMLFMTRENGLMAFFNAIECVEHIFPNIMMHSDCGGNYTKNGKVNPHTCETGNSKALLVELETLLSYEDFKKLQDERTKRAIEYTKKLYHLVKDEIENGTGTIIFS